MNGSSKLDTYLNQWGGYFQSSTQKNYGQDFRFLTNEYQNGYSIFGYVENGRRYNMYAKIVGNTFYWYSNYAYKEDGPTRQFNIKDNNYYWIAF